MLDQGEKHVLSGNGPLGLGSPCFVLVGSWKRGAGPVLHAGSTRSSFVLLLAQQRGAVVKRCWFGLCHSNVLGVGHTPAQKPAARQRLTAFCEDEAGFGFVSLPTQRVCLSWTLLNEQYSLWGAESRFRKALSTKYNELGCIFLHLSNGSCLVT